MRRALGRPWSAQAFGGGTAFYAGIAFRYRLVDFDARDYVATDAMNPKWPITYDDLRPYYDEVERRIGIARTDDGDPLAPPSTPAVMPAHPFSLPGSLLADAASTLGLRPFPTPLAVNSIPYRGRSQCAHLTPCNEYACPIGARADAAMIFLGQLGDHEALTVAFRSRVIHIGLARPDRARWVEWLNLTNRTRCRSKVKLVLLAANAIQSSVLLLRSGQRWATTGLGNRRDMVGRGLSFKVSGSVEALLCLPRNRSNRTTGPHSTVAISDYYLDSCCPSGLGGLMYETSPESRTIHDGQIIVRIHYLAGDQPAYGNRIQLVQETDEYDLPKIEIDYTTHPMDVQRLQYLKERATEILVAAGANMIISRESQYELGSRHLHGGCRAGIDPTDSVVDDTGRVHDLSNVYVIDGAFFPFAGGVNPTLTIQANALRISSQLAKNFP